MSLSSFKETLKPCTISASSTSSSSSCNWNLSTSEFNQTLQRKPPKSSLSLQLQRLQESPPRLSKSAVEDKKQKEEEEQKDVGEEEDEGDDNRPIIRSEPVSFISSSNPTGPFEPFILSSPSEIPVVQIPASINCRLFGYQREGVKFLYNLYKKNHGGVLGDDMGLGKTIQTIALLAAVFGNDAEHCDTKMVQRDHDRKKGPVLIICPTSVIQNWENEFSVWANFSVAVYHGQNRNLVLEKLEACGVEILITSFDTFRIHDEILVEVQWDIVIVDEAHRLKNEKSQLYKSCLGIKTTKRFGLTGTIMQNKIMELFNILDWVAPGSLGTREHFREFYDEPLKHGQRLSAPKRFVQIADERKQHLAEVLQRYLLRRTKEETIGHLMRGKEDNVIFCAMSELQKRVYRRMLQLPDIQCLINKDLPCSCGSPLTQVECCYRIVKNGLIWPYLHENNPEGCESCPFCIVLPCLVKLQQISNHLELIKPNPRDDKEKQKKDAVFASAVFGSDIDLVGGCTPNESFMGLSDVEHCGKMRALDKLMLTWVSQGDKILLFSYSVRMLDILEKFLIRKGYCFSRLDGSTPMSSRQSLVDEFNSSPSKQVFLISTRAGGLGLNLVSANRVVIFDPNWNPAHDLQAQDRSFRYGQRRHVVVFRLLAAGSLEELVYSRQVYKQQLSNIAVSGKMEQRYFEGVQDCKVFKGELFGICNLFRDLSDKLFTRQIIELHEKHGVEPENSQAGRESTVNSDSLISPKIDWVVPEKANEALAPQFTKADGLVMARESDAVLDDLGIIYAHRNEDVVNYKPELQGEKEASSSEHADLTVMNYVPSKSIRLKRHAQVRASCKQQKKSTTYSLLAQFVGMGELEFSKWLLSASPSQREKVLRDYNKKRQREKMENG